MGQSKDTVEDYGAGGVGIGYRPSMKKGLFG